MSLVPAGGRLSGEIPRNGEVDESRSLAGGLDLTEAGQAVRAMSELLNIATQDFHACYVFVILA